MNERNRKNDLAKLVVLLEMIEKELKKIVDKQEELFRKEFLKLFTRDRWVEVEQCFRKAKDMLYSQNLSWEHLEGVGMTNKNLDFKVSIFEESIREGVVVRILKVMNSLLGSLSRALAPLEFVKEYKEMVEASLSYFKRWERLR